MAQGTKGLRDFHFFGYAISLLRNLRVSLPAKFDWAKYRVPIEPTISSWPVCNLALRFTDERADLHAVTISEHCTSNRGLIRAVRSRKETLALGLQRIPHWLRKTAGKTSIPSGFEDKAGVFDQTRN